MITHDGSRWTLHFSDGRQEHFSSEKAAQHREHQVNYFKHVKKDGPGAGATGGSGNAGPVGSGSPLGTADLGAGGKLVATQGAQRNRCRECRLGPRGLTRCCKSLLHGDRHVDQHGSRWVSKRILPVVQHQGIRVHLDRPKGYVQSGTSPEGEPWERTYTHDYGFIPLTAGGDDEELDVFLGPNPEAPISFWALQLTPDGAFDEYKVFLGCDSVEEAQAIYEAHIPREFLGAWSTMSVGQIRALLGQQPEEALLELTRKAAPVTPAITILNGSSVTTAAREPDSVNSERPRKRGGPRKDIFAGEDDARTAGWEPPMSGARG